MLGSSQWWPSKSLGASSVAEYGPCLFFQSGNFQGVVEELLKLESRISATEKVLSPYSSKSLLFLRAATPSNPPESLNFHLGIKKSPCSDPKMRLGQVLVGSGSFLWLWMAPARRESTKGKAEQTQPSWRGTGGNSAAPRGWQEDPNLHLSIKRNKHPLQD